MPVVFNETMICENDIDEHHLRAVLDFNESNARKADSSAAAKRRRVTKNEFVGEVRPIKEGNKTAGQKNGRQALQTSDMAFPTVETERVENIKDEKTSRKKLRNVSSK